MQYVDRVLEPGETIRYNRTILNWPLLVQGLLMLLIAFFLGLAQDRMYMYLSRDDLQSIAAVLNRWLGGDSAVTSYSARIIIGDIHGIFVILFILGGISAIIRSRSTEVAITDRRIVHKRGLIGRVITEIPIGHIDSIEIRQSVLQRVFSFGSIRVTSIGGAKIPLKILAPIKLREHVLTPRLNI